ncbi:MAG: hypothetical protein L3J71_03590 [Victivallaceae bacterium]|nr:hypothetical protein [Victivallaceae bacterium]
MRDNRTYQIRQIILQASAESDPAPMNLDILVNHPAFGLIHPTREEINSEITALRKHGYLKACAGSNLEYFAITGEGTDQINQEVDRDQFVWGKWGLKTT